MAKHILLVEVVEDEASLRRALAEKLTKEGYQVSEAADGEAGLAVASEHHPDLILLDLLMPRLDGLGMLQRLRQEPWGQDLPVIILTNVNEVEKVQEAVTNQTFDFLVKADWTLEQIVQKVHEKIGDPNAS